MRYNPKLNTVIKCEHCGFLFHPLTPNQKYCSINCRTISLRERRRERYKNGIKKTYECLYCHRKIDANKNNKYCSKQCRDLDRNRRRVEKNAKLKIEKLNIEPRYCKHCGRLIQINNKNKYKYEDVKFCCRKCAMEYFWKNDDRKHSFYKDGFHVIIREISKTEFSWYATKNNKVVLESDKNFADLDSAYNDARKAFVS